MYILLKLEISTSGEIFISLRPLSKFVTYIKTLCFALIFEVFNDVTGRLMKRGTHSCIAVSCRHQNVEMEYCVSCKCSIDGRL
jgi:hypothetical protein